MKIKLIGLALAILTLSAFYTETLSDQYFHIQILENPNITVGDKVKCLEKEIGEVSDLSLKNEEIIATVRINSTYKIPVNSTFKIYDPLAIGQTAINVYSSAELNYYTIEDTVELEQSNESSFYYSIEVKNIELATSRDLKMIQEDIKLIKQKKINNFNNIGPPSFKSRFKLLNELNQK